LSNFLVRWGCEQQKSNNNLSIPKQYLIVGIIPSYSAAVSFQPKFGFSRIPARSQTFFSYCRISNYQVYSVKDCMSFKLQEFEQGVQAVQVSEFWSLVCNRSIIYNARRTNDYFYTTPQMCAVCHRVPTLSGHHSSSNCLIIVHLLLQMALRSKKFGMPMSTYFIDTRAASSLPIFLALETRQIPMICIWLYFENFGVIGMAVSSCSAMKKWLITFKSMSLWHSSH
jgi:hypothetical protein